MSGGKKAAVGGAYMLNLTSEELGIIAICLSAVWPNDHEEEFDALRNRVVKAWAERNPDAYDIAVQVGEMRPFDTTEVAKAKRILRKAGLFAKPTPSPDILAEIEEHRSDTKGAA